MTHEELAALSDSELLKIIISDHIELRALIRSVNDRLDAYIAQLSEQDRQAAIDEV